MSFYTLTKMPVDMAIHNIEIARGNGGQLVRAVGGVAKLIANADKSTTLRLPSEEGCLIIKNLKTA